jgi:hypothetical protein
VGSVDLAVVDQVVAPERADLGLTAGGEGIKARVGLEGILALLLSTVDDNVGVVDDGLVEGAGRGKLVLGEISGGDSDGDTDLTAVQHGAVLETVGSQALTRLGRDGSTSGEELNAGARVPGRRGANLDVAAASRAGQVSGNGNRSSDGTNTGRWEVSQQDDTLSGEGVLITSGDGHGDRTSTITGNNLPADSIGGTSVPRVGGRARGSSTTAVTAKTKPTETSEKLGNETRGRFNAEMAKVSEIQLQESDSWCSGVGGCRRRQKPQTAQQKKKVSRQEIRQRSEATPLGHKH